MKLTLSENIRTLRKQRCKGLCLSKLCGILRVCAHNDAGRIQIIIQRFGFS